MEQEKRQGLVAIVLANIIFGLNTPVTKALMESWMTPSGYTATRMFFGAILFWVLGLFVKDINVERKDLLMMLVGGLIGFIGTQLLFSQALTYTTPVIFSLIMALTPVMVLLMSAVFLKESVPARKVVGVVLSISGAALIIWLSGSNDSIASNNTLGILIAFLCALCYGTYMILTRKISIKYKPVTIAKWMFLVSAVAALPFSFDVLQTETIYTAEPNWQAYGLLLFSLLFSTTLAFFLMPFALKRLEASAVSIFMNLQPLVSSVVAIAVGQDNLTWDKPIAALLVISGVYLVTKKKAVKA